MITTFEIVDILWQQLFNSDLRTLISGGIYKEGTRPINSQNEDIVIGCLPVNNAQIQEAIANVNIHVPSADITGNDIQDFQPDHKRLKELTRVAVDLLNAWGEDYNYEVQQQVLITDGHQHYVNIRIEFFNINIE